MHLDVSNMVRVRLSHFYGIEIEEWPARIAETAMFLVDQQANHDLAITFGNAPDRLPIMNAVNITVGNALRVDWEGVLPAKECSYIVGNPPFIGTRLQSDDQKEDQRSVWYESPKAGSVDYVTNWFVKASHYMAGQGSAAAFVATSSITQGEQAALLWGELKKSGVEISFAHRTFAWSSEAPGAANVHVVIVGFRRAKDITKRRLFEYPELRAEPVERIARFINAYLIDGPDVLVKARTKPMRSDIPSMEAGNEPRDGGFLSNISDEEANKIRASDQIAAKYLRRIYGSQEHLHAEKRWCLWLRDAEPSDIRNSQVLHTRVGQVLAERSGKKGHKGKAADRPSLFSYICQPRTNYLLVPSVSSETRRFIPVGYYSADDIATNAVFMIAGSDLELFGIMSSSMFVSWVGLVSSRLESRFQISTTAVYNTFPFPDKTDQAKHDRVILAATEILEVRSARASSSLADLYDPLAMPADLLLAHIKLDTAVDALFGSQKFANNLERETFLLTRYAELTADLLTELPAKKTRKKKTD
jgi:hypothetical protein